MRIVLYVFAVFLALSCCVNVLAAEQYTEAKIAQIEPGDASIYLFLDVVSGAPPPVGNSGSNESINKPYLALATTVADVASRQHFLQPHWLR
jgi:hypothetical protein